MDKNTVNLTVNCDMSEVESKVTRLVELLKEVNTLVDELTSKGIKLNVSGEETTEWEKQQLKN